PHGTGPRTARGKSARCFQPQHRNRARPLPGSSSRGGLPVVVAVVEALQGTASRHPDQVGNHARPRRDRSAGSSHVERFTRTCGRYGHHRSVPAAHGTPSSGAALLVPRRVQRVARLWHGARFRTCCVGTDGSFVLPCRRDGPRRRVCSGSLKVERRNNRISMESRMRRTILVFALLAACAFVVAKPVPDSGTPLVLKPTADQAEAAIWAMRFLSRFHYKPVPLDDAMSEKIFSNYLDSLDGEHLFFTQADVDSFSSARDKLDDAVFERDLS